MKGFGGFAVTLVDLARVYAAYVLCRRSRLDYPPFRFWIEPTDACNLRCVMCPREHDRTGGRFMDMELFRSLLRMISPFVRDAALHHRGEPLLHPEICGMLREASAVCYTKLHTNGMLLDKNTAEALVASGLDSLTFSFDGISPEFYESVRRGGDYATVMKNIETFLDVRRSMSSRKPYVHVEVIRMEDHPLFDMEKVKSFRRTLRRMGVDGFELHRLHNWGGLLESSSYDRRPPVGGGRCLFPWFSMVVLADGTVTACPQDYAPAYPVGDIGKQGIMEIWNGERMIALREALLSGRLDGFPCEHCDMLLRPSLLGVPVTSFAGVANIFRFG